MPYVRTPEEEEEQRRAQSSAVGTGAVGAAGAGVDAQPGARPGGSSFVNLQDYLTANAGQGQQMADRIAAPIEQAGAKVEGAAQPAMATGPTLTTTDMGTVNPALKSAAGVEREASRVQSQAGLLGSWGGREQLLKQQAGPGYSQGEANFDNALMGGGGGGTRLGELSKRYSGLSSMVGQRQAGYGYAQPAAALAPGTHAASPVGADADEDDADVKQRRAGKTPKNSYAK